MGMLSLTRIWIRWAITHILTMRMMMRDHAVDGAIVDDSAENANEYEDEYGGADDDGYGEGGDDADDDADDAGADDDDDDADDE
eukprot:1798092-Pyramimonas_sp.AAC.1